MWRNRDIASALCYTGRMSSTPSRARPPPDSQRDLIKLIGELGYRYGHWQVFADFVEMAAISISNAVDIAQRGRLEQRYVEMIKRYKPDELASTRVPVAPTRRRDRG